MPTYTQTQIEDIYKLLSPNCNTRFLLNKYFPEAEYGDESAWIDVHSKFISNLLRLPRDGELIYNNALPVTSHSQRYYGTVSLWWLIVFCSDYLHPHCIPTNATIKIPVLNVIGSYLSNDVDTGLAGKVITI